MSNVFTRQSRYPRTTTQADFNGHEARKIVKLPHIPSATRVGNPHPEGLAYQALPNEEIVSIWNPNFYKYAMRMPTMLQHLDKVNFTCGKFKMAPTRFGKYEHVIYYTALWLPGKIPDIKYTESTISRISYRNPNTFPALYCKIKCRRLGYTPISEPAIGIVPDVSAPNYRTLEPGI